MPVVGISVADNIRKAFRESLRRIPGLAGLFAVVASLGLVVLVVGMIGLHGMYTTDRRVHALEEVGRRAFFAEHANSLIYAVVMDSRGVYMSSGAADRARYGAGIMKFLAELEANMAAWKQHIAPEDREDFARAQARTQEFIRFRTELVRLGNEVGQDAAREWGDNEVNRANREALNRAIGTLASSNYAELEELRASINAYSAWQFALATAAMAGGILLAVLLIVLMVRRHREELAHVGRLATVGELTAWITHEVNQPLAAIITNGGACLRWLGQGIPDEARSSVESMIREARRASEVIRSIRALAKKSEPEKAPLRINDLIHEVVRLVQREALRHGASLRLQLAPTLPSVMGDRVQLQQVVINLVLNALQAMASVTGRRRVVLIRSQREDDGRVVVAVADTGTGIEPKTMDKLFQAFFTTKPSGMGMGLSICRSIIEAHGGQVSAANNLGPGATFQVILPSSGT